MIFRLGGLWLVGLSCAGTLGACIPGSSEVGSMNGGGGGQGPECEAGATKPAGDGCNTCTCDDAGGWTCTQLACGVCEEGAMRAAEDGCNTCTCLGGEWSCTLRECQTCTIGERRDTECGSCWCADNGNGPTWSCSANYCPEECEPGETKPAGDGCNTCMCVNGDWGCTTKECGTLVCDEGLGDCDGVLSNGCETNLDTSVENCGLCGNHCAIVGAYAACEAGVCVLDRCDPPYADCNGDPADGCESPVAEGGCADRCEPADAALAPVATDAACECPEGMACVRSGVENAATCVPIPKGCTNGFANCLCMADCACDEGARSSCSEEMSLGGMIINCNGML